MAIDVIPTPRDGDRRASLLDILRERAAQAPDHTAFIFLRDGEGDVVTWNYQTFYDASIRVRDAILQYPLNNRRVLLVLEPGLNYVAALFGILFAGATAVPSFPPAGSRAIARFASICRDAHPDIVIAGTGVLELLKQHLNQFYAQAGVQAVPALLGIDQKFFDGENVYAYKKQVTDLPPGDAERPALLQYTSGSTGEPKGVIVTHDNLVSNCAVIAQRLGDDPERVGCTWLPPYHDMGLMGALLLAVYSGFPLVILSPQHFVQRPYRWLKAINDYRVTTSVAPNFAFDLCVDNISEAEAATLDLSSLQHVFCGAEPVRYATLERFFARYEPRGFDRHAIVPCYGMAEATLYVSGKRGREPITLLDVDKDALAAGICLPYTGGTDTPLGHARLVGCGPVAAGHELRIVDPQTRQPLPERAIGEIWVAGPNVAAGYLNRDDSDDIFAATLAADAPQGGRESARYLRTGDLGFVERGELFVTGRLKDVVIVAGRNLYPNDIEGSVQQAHDAIRTNGVAAFSVEGETSESLIIVAEIKRTKQLNDAQLSEVREAITRAVTRDHGVAPAFVHLGPMGAIPLTTSGKVRRQACKQAFQKGSLRVFTASA
ncbi:fatty acyl-AMP ligase [Burkholderia sp. TSV86]|uniref:fatty acyl-AMP ligase n=1 Tax=Burkholderia sp. TSV86 TaxID=1385594 RepID=UPI0007565550|nr:fatty acyl-AMP ligase [Burkholderia sp. TSV86]KVE37891.1 AMP-dependent synthetase [Burkholderia sp. TSV86]